MTLPTDIIPAANPIITLHEAVNASFQLGQLAADYFERNNIAINPATVNPEFTTVRSANGVVHEVVFSIDGQRFSFRFVNVDNHCYIQEPPPIVAQPMLVVVE